MPEKAELHRLRLMLKIQEARRSEADHAVQSAREVRQSAQAAAEVGRSNLEQAAAEWQGHLTGSSFNPDFGRWFAEQVTVRTAECRRAEDGLDAAQRIVDRREQDWRQREAEVRAGERLLERRVRNRNRVLEERRLAAADDRVAHLWAAR